VTVRPWFSQAVGSFLYGSYYSAEYIFPDFSEQNESFSLTNLFMRNTNAGFQSLAITLETRAAEQMKK